MDKELLINIIPLAATAAALVSGVVNIISYRKKTKKKMEEAENFLKSSKTFFALSNTLIKRTALKNEEIFRDINNINSEIKYLFDDLTKSHCRSTIRVIVYDDNVPMVVSFLSQSQHDNTRHKMEFEKTKLFDDTYMSLFLNKHKDYYLNNDLSEINSYLPVMPKADKDINWQVHYLSTLVIPITKADKDINKDFLYGFLCIDSDMKNAYKKEFHVTIAKQISFSLLPLLDKWTKRMIENNSSLTPVTTTSEIEDTQ